MDFLMFPIDIWYTRMLHFQHHSVMSYDTWMA